MLILTCNIYLLQWCHLTWCRFFCSIVPVWSGSPCSIVPEKIIFNIFMAYICDNFLKLMISYMIYLCNPVMAPLWKWKIEIHSVLFSDHSITFCIFIFNIGDYTNLFLVLECVLLTVIYLPPCCCWLMRQLSLLDLLLVCSCVYSIWIYTQNTS